jgi:hypothetical protein
MPRLRAPKSVASPEQAAARFEFLELLDRPAVEALVTACDDEDGLRELSLALGMRLAAFEPPLEQDREAMREKRPALAGIDTLKIGAQYNLARDAAQRIVGVPHLMPLVPSLDRIRDRLTPEIVSFLLERVEAGIRDELVLVPRVDDRVVPMRALLDGYDELRRSLVVEELTNRVVDRPATPDRSNYLTKGLWNRPDSDRAHNVRSHLGDGKDPPWRVVFVLGDSTDPTDPTRPVNPHGEPGLVHPLDSPHAMVRALDRERVVLAKRGLVLAEMSPAAYVLTNAIRGLSGRRALDGRSPTSTVFTHYRHMNREPNGVLFPSASTRNWRIYLDEVPSKAKTRLRTIGVRRVLEVM